MMDYIEFDDGFAIVKMRPPREAWDKTLRDSALRTRYGVTIVGVKRPGAEFTHALPETVVRQGDLLIVSGQAEVIEKFAVDTNA